MYTLPGFAALLAAFSVGSPLPPKAPMRMVDPLPSPFSQPLPATLNLGSQGPRVRALNRRLRDLSFLPARSADSEFGQPTFEAVRAFQKSTGLPVDGSVGPSTWRRLARAAPPLPRRSVPGRHAEVWLDRQLLLLVKDGVTSWVVHVSTGQPGLDTPPGSFKVYLKDPAAYSTQYDAPMPFASYYSGGYAIHQSDSVPEYPASHGCTRVPAVFAQAVFDWLSEGDPVYVLAGSPS